MNGPDGAPEFTTDDQIEMERLERHAAMAGFLDARLREWSLSESARDQILYAWSASWWEKA